MNSSDKTWRELFNKFNETYKLNRFRELGELKYSMRSVYKHMKFINNYKESNFEEINKFLIYYHNKFKNIHQCLSLTRFLTISQSQKKY